MQGQAQRIKAVTKFLVINSPVEMCWSVSSFTKNLQAPVLACAGQFEFYHFEVLRYSCQKDARCGVRSVTKVQETFTMSLCNNTFVVWDSFIWLKLPRFDSRVLMSSTMNCTINNI